MSRGTSTRGAGAPPGPASRADGARRRFRPGPGVGGFVAGGLAVTMAAVPVMVGLSLLGDVQTPTVVFERCEHEDPTASGPDGSGLRTGVCVQHVVRDPVLGEHLDEVRFVVRDGSGTPAPRAMSYGWSFGRDTRPTVRFGERSVVVSDGYVTATYPRAQVEDVD